LRNSDGEAHTLEQVVELFNIDVVVLVDVDFIKYILQRQTSLFEYLDNVIENLVLSVFLLTL
jgi:rRNA-processing protein FCF1